MCARFRQMHSMLRKAGILLCLCLLAAGLAHTKPVFAASQLSVAIPYSQTWTNDSARSNVANTFDYVLRPADGNSPAPLEATDRNYRFSIAGSVEGDLNLHFNFNSPGYYNYLVTADVGDPADRYTYEARDYDVMLMVINGDNGLTLGAMTIKDANSREERKFDALEMNVSYYEAQQGGQTPAPSAQTTRNTQTTRTVNTSPAQVPTVDESAEEPPAVVTDDGEEIGDEDIPLARPEEPTEDYWALLNLLLMLATIVICILALVLTYRKAKDGEEDVQFVGDEEEDDTTVKRKFVFCLLGAIAAVISVVLFFWTEDVRLPMEWTDEWTIWMIIILIAEAVFAILTRIRKKEQEEEQLS